MKKIIFSFLFSGLAVLAFAQDGKLESELCKAWKINKTMIDGKKVDDPFQSSTIYDFKTDGSFTTSIGEGDGALVTHGKWKYDEACKCIEMDNEAGESTATAHLKSKTKLILKPTMSSTSKVRVEYHAEPK